MAEDFLLPRVLLTNDDGFDAPGLAVLAEIAATFAQEVWIVAPSEDQSGASNRVSLRSPIKIEQRGERQWAVNGSPADCVAIALDYLMDQNLPTLVLSGINATSNVGDETHLSGTIGAATMALMAGIPALALSQEGPSRKEIPWDTARAVLPLVLKPLLKKGWRKETILSINIPALPPEKITGLSWARQGKKNIFGIKAHRRVSPRDEEYFWLTLKERPMEEQEDNEAAIMARGEVAVTMLSLDRSVESGHASISFIEKPKDEELPDPELLAEAEGPILDTTPVIETDPEDE